MKTTLTLPLFLFLPILITAQNRIDTLEIPGKQGQMYYHIIEHYPEGVVKKITYRFGLEDPLSKEELFMRGIKTVPENAGWQSVDSIFTYHPSGRVLERAYYSRGKTVTYHHEYDEAERLIRIVKTDGSGMEKHLLFGEAAIELENRSEVIEGRIGHTLDHAILLSTSSDKTSRLKVMSSSPYLRLPSSITLAPRSSVTIDMQVRIPADIVKTEIILKNEKNEEYRLPVEILGYDLFARDFINSRADLRDQIFEMKDRRSLVIKSDGSEKLLRLYQNETLVDNYPFSQIRSQINIKGFKKGVYLVEAVDLGKNEKKYCRINID